HSPLDRVQESMEQSPSPFQYGLSSYSHRAFRASFSAVPASACESAPHSRRAFRDQVVAVQGCPSCATREKSKPAGKNAPPAHCPSGSWWEIRRAPNPSDTTDALVAAHTASGAPARSRSTCQRNAGSESSNQPMTSPVMSAIVERCGGRRYPGRAGRRVTDVTRLPARVSEIFDPMRWREIAGFDFTDITYHRGVRRNGEERDLPVVRIAFDRPSVRNAFRPHTVDELYRALDHARMTSDVAAIILTGNGPSPKDGGWAFCSGGDQRIRGRDGYRYHRFEDAAGSGHAEAVDPAR